MSTPANLDQSQNESKQNFSAPRSPNPPQSPQVNPSGRPSHSTNMTRMMEITINSVKELGFQKYRATDNQNKFTIMFAITNQGQSTDDS